MPHRLKQQNATFDNNNELRKIRHDIYNMKKISPEQLDKLKDLSHKDKDYIIAVYNQMMDWFEEISELL
jgi:hypothetical protein